MQSRFVLMFTFLSFKANKYLIQAIVNVALNYIKEVKLVYVI